MTLSDVPISDLLRMFRATSDALGMDAVESELLLDELCRRRGRRLLISSTRGRTIMQKRHIQQLLSRKQAAQFLGISVRMLDYLASTGEIRRIRIGSAVRYDILDLLEFAEGRKEAIRQ